jgi:hypothetical protein
MDSYGYPVNWTVIERLLCRQGGEQSVHHWQFSYGCQYDFRPYLSNVALLPYLTIIIDDVWIIPAVPCDILDVDLGDDVVACFELHHRS